jgi:hypothetical protein
VADNLTISGGTINNSPIGATTPSTGVFTNATATNATTSNLAVTGSSQVGTIISGVWNGTVIGDAFITKTGDWTGTFDGQEGSYYLANSFSTTSANVWLTTKSTTDLSEGTRLYYTDARVNSYINGSTTIPKTYTANTFTGANTFNGTLTVGLLNGPLDARNGVVGATSSIGVLYGGTGLTTAPNFGQLLLGTAAGGYVLSATSTLGIAISDTTGTLSVSRGGTGSTTLTGLLKGNGTGGIQTAIPGNDYLISALTSIGPTNQTTTGPAVTLATSTSVTNGMTSAISIVGSGSTLTFTPSQSGTLTAGGGGTGISNPTAAGVLVGSYAGGSYQQLATSSLGLLTTNVAEGSNLYYLDSRVQSFVHASTTIPKVYTSNTFTNTNTFSGSSIFNGGVTIGSLNGPLDARNGVVGATSSIGVLYGGTGLTSGPSFGQLLIGNALGGYTLSATSTLGISLADTIGSLGVSRGGTGVSSFGQGWVYTDGGTNALGASTSPTVNYITATSTTATSTFGWGVQANVLNVTSSIATSTFANGINLSTGCFAVLGSCISGSGATGITSLGAQYSSSLAAASQTFATSSDTNIGLVITSSGSTHTFTPTFTGTLADAPSGG